MFDNFNYSNKKKLSPYAVFMISLILVITISASIAAITANVSVNANTAEEQVDTSVSTTPTAYYVKEYDGKIAIFTDLTKPPIEITETSIDNFPQEDKEMLSVGIKVNDEKELKRLLEDYCS